MTRNPSATNEPRRLCDSGALKPRGSVRFDLGVRPGPFGPIPLEGMLVRDAAGIARAYLNLCPHRGQPLDLGDGRLFLPDGTLECQAHGAAFDPQTGACVRGPSGGRGLTALRVEERGGEIWLLPSEEEPL